MVMLRKPGKAAKIAKKVLLNNGVKTPPVSAMQKSKGKTDMPIR